MLKQELYIGNRRTLLHFTYFDHHLTTTVQQRRKTPKKPVVTTNNRLFLVLGTANFDMLYRRADLAMYQSKKQAGFTATIYGEI